VGWGNDVLNKIVLYSLNNIVSVGNFSGIVDFDPSPNTNNFTSLGNTDGLFAMYLTVSGHLFPI
jgi:hypothetical protein